jgi:ubiquinone biosynthesis accessory factor UbiJ
MLPALLSSAALKALQHVLAQHAWARQLLQQHQGQSLVLGVSGTPQLDMRLMIGSDGLLKADPSTAEPTLRFYLKPSLDVVRDWIAQGPNGLQRHLVVQGDVMLAASFAQLAQNMRWDFETDLSRVIGDMAAHRVGEQVRAAPERLKRFQSQIEASASEWLTTETAQLVSQSQWGQHREQLRILGQQIQALEARIARLG